MIERIKQLAKQFNIDIVGTTSGDVFLKEQEKIRTRIGQDGLSPFIKGDFNQLTNPKLVWSEAKSIISIALSYRFLKNLENTVKDSGQIASVAWGEDYHNVLMKKMEIIMNKLQKEYQDLQYYAYVDNAPLLDRAVAYRSGIGFYGKNNFIINPKYGSYIFLGHILTNKIILQSTHPLKNACGNCTKCIESCPTNALSEYRLDASKCISYLTQDKSLLERWKRVAIGAQLYGCDICQEACPYNHSALSSTHKEFETVMSMIHPSLEYVMKMSKKEFGQTFGQTAAGWRGKKLLQRNAIIVAGNNRSEYNKNLLINMLGNDSWEKRIYSMFSLLEYGEEERKIVRDRLVSENQEFIDKFKEYKD